MDLIGSESAACSTGPMNSLLSTFLSAIIALHCNISTPDLWPRDFGPNILDNGYTEYDFIVIGAGTAGSVVAGRLAENLNDKILLIEAGGDPPFESEIPGLWRSNFFTKIDWQYKTEARYPCYGQKGEFCVWNKGKALGGSHAINSMVYLRGNARDYDAWMRAGNPGWGWKDIQPFFRKTENFKPYDVFGEHGRGGPLNIEKFKSPKIDEANIWQMARELGYEKIGDFVAGLNMGFGDIYATLQDGRRMSTARAFLSKKLPNLHVIKHAYAINILFNRYLRATQVKLIYKWHYPLVVRARKEIIISAGTVETPKLLMRSGIGPKVHLNALHVPLLVDLPVGNNVQDQFRVAVFFRYKYQQPMHHDSSTASLDAFYNLVVHQSGAYGASVINTTGLVNTAGHGYFPDVQYLFSSVINITEYTSTYKYHIQRSLEDQVKSSDRVVAAYVNLLNPESRGHIRLRSEDYRDSPLIYPHYYSAEEDARTIIRGIEKLLEFENTITFRDLRGSFMRVDLPECKTYEYRSQDYWKCYIKYMSSSSNHPVGSAKMGAKDDITTVVNSDLEVHGVKGLRVIDSSVMPNAVSAISNTATIMIGEKGADLVNAKWAY